jgi:hypothetical protein
MTDPSSGIEGVAKFIPSDANLSQPVVSPSEPLGDGEAHITEDAEIPDAPSLAPTATETHSAIVNQNLLLLMVLLPPILTQNHSQPQIFSTVSLTSQSRMR